MWLKYKLAVLLLLVLVVAIVPAQEGFSGSKPREHRLLVRKISVAQVEKDEDYLRGLHLETRTDSGMPKDELHACKPVDPNKPYATNRKTMRQCADNVVELLRVMRKAAEDKHDSRHVNAGLK